MTVFDYIVLGLLVLSALVGTWRGLVSEVIALFAWLVAGFAAWMYSERAAPLLAGVVTDPLWRQVAAGALIFVGVLALAALLRFLLRELLKAAGLGPVDRLFGTVFGVARGLAIVLVLVLFGGLVGAADESWWQEALLSPPLETAVIAAKPWLPEAVAEKIRFR
ncbi:MAG TPA: CvpA family protein [Rhodocyclaceae bacterium]|nr:CvpA family protein [Rhodocyclaceae bacterium]